MRRFAWAAALLSLAAAGCAPTVGRPAPTIRKMGERVEVGSLIYTVTETAWADELGAPPAPCMPARRFLEVRISVTNSGIARALIPEAVLVNGEEAYPELSTGCGLENWLGLLRTVDPAETVRGSLLFDAPLGSYILRLGESGDSGQAGNGLVELPLELPHSFVAPVLSGIE